MSGLIQDLTVSPELIRNIKELIRLKAEAIELSKQKKALGEKIEPLARSIASRMTDGVYVHEGWVLTVFGGGKQCGIEKGREIG